MRRNLYPPISHRPIRTDSDLSEVSSGRPFSASIKNMQVPPEFHLTSSGTQKIVQMKKAGIFCFEDFGFFLLRKFKNESRQFIPSGGIELVPFFPCEGDFCPFDDAWNTGSVSCTYNHLYVGRMAQKPCYGYAVFCGVVFFR